MHNPADISDWGRELWSSSDCFDKSKVEMSQALIDMLTQSAFQPLGKECLMIESGLAQPNEILVLNQPQNGHKESEFLSDSSSALPGNTTYFIFIWDPGSMK